MQLSADSATTSAAPEQSAVPPTSDSGNAHVTSAPEATLSASTIPDASGSQARSEAFASPRQPAAPLPSAPQVPAPSDVSGGSRAVDDRKEPEQQQQTQQQQERQREGVSDATIEHAPNADAPASQQQQQPQQPPPAPAMPPRKRTNTTVSELSRTQSTLHLSRVPSELTRSNVSGARCSPSLLLASALPHSSLVLCYFSLHVGSFETKV